MKKLIVALGVVRQWKLEQTNKQKFSRDFASLFCSLPHCTIRLAPSESPSTSHDVTHSSSLKQYILVCGLKNANEPTEQCYNSWIKREFLIFFVLFLTWLTTSSLRFIFISAFVIEICWFLFIRVMSLFWYFLIVFAAYTGKWWLCCWKLFSSQKWAWEKFIWCE